MAFLAPWMLWGALAAAVPIILHFLFRSRYRRLPWAAMKFLRTAVEQVQRRLKFQELLLLITRATLLVLLAVALARLSSAARPGTGAGDAVDAVLVVDVSGSMGARDGNATRLERAKAAALAVIDHLPPRSTVQIVASADRAMPQGPAAASNLEAARQIVRSLTLTHLSTDFLPAAAEASALLDRGHSPNKEFYLLSDLQRSGWDRQPAALAARLREIGRKAAVFLVRCGTREPRNVTLAGIAPPSGIPHAGERTGFAVLVRNSGSQAAHDLTVSLEVDGQGRETQSVASLAPGETQAVTLTARFDRPGPRVLSAAVGPDEMESDNRFLQVLRVREQVRVLVVEGAPNEMKPELASAFYLLHSLRPVPEPSWGAYHLQPRTVSAGDASPALLGDADLCILVNAAVPGPGERPPGALPPEFLERLAGFVREGRGLLIFLGPRVSPETCNRVLFEEHGLLPFPLGRLETLPASAPLRPDPLSIDPQSFLAAFREEPLSRVGQTHVQRYVLLEESAGPRESRAVLRFANGRAAVAVRRAGAGRVILVSTSADPQWTDWPLRHTFLPFVHAALGHLLAGEAEMLNRTAGEPLRWHPPAAASARIHAVVDPEGRRTRLGVPERAEGRPVLTHPDTARAGLYRFVPVDPVPAGEDAAGVLFAVNPDPAESENLEALSERAIDERLGFPVRHRTAGEDPGDLAGAERLRREWTPWLLLGVLVLALFEMVLAWYCDRGW